LLGIVSLLAKLRRLQAIGRIERRTHTCGSRPQIRIEQGTDARPTGGPD